MTDFEIGDEEFAEEINTSYDQEQPIGDSPQAYYAVGAEPIDAKNGDNFMSVGRLNETLEKCLACDGTGWNEMEDVECPVCHGGGKFDPDKPYSGESLNKDGTGIARATKGIDPTKTKRKWLRFIYVSKSNCDICKEFDGKIYKIDDEDRPCIPRLEEWNGARPVTHPNCKCKWVRTFSPEDFGATEALAMEIMDDENSPDNPKNHEFLSEYAIDSPDYNKECQTCGFPKSSHKHNSEEVDEKTLARTKQWYGVGFDELSPLEQKMEVINMLKQNVGVERATEASPYGIQNMLDDIVKRSFGKTEQQEVAEKMDVGFSLDVLLDLVAEKLAKKAGKKLGLESVAQEFDIGDCPMCDGKGCEYCDNTGKFKDDHNQATEGGKGSGKHGHQKWMLGAEVGEECPHCLMYTTFEDGKCTVCLN